MLRDIAQLYPTLPPTNPNSNMTLKGNVRALLEVYRKALDELILLIEPLPPATLQRLADPDTDDPDGRSIQSVLAHVVCSGFNYTVYLENWLGEPSTRRERVYLNTAAEYAEQLNAMFQYCETFFQNHPQLDIEESDNDKKIRVNWGQTYDVEQLMEHAIVHVWRHRRQIARFLDQNQ